MDYTTLAGSMLGTAAAMVLMCVLRKQPKRVILRLGGSVLLEALTLLGIAFGAISGIIVWDLTGISAAVLATFFYIALRPGSASPPTLYSP